MKPQDDNSDPNVIIAFPRRYDEEKAGNDSRLRFLRTLSALLVVTALHICMVVSSQAEEDFSLYYKLRQLEMDWSSGLPDILSVENSFQHTYGSGDAFTAPSVFLDLPGMLDSQNPTFDLSGAAHYARHTFETTDGGWDHSIIYEVIRNGVETTQTIVESHLTFFPNLGETVTSPGIFIDQFGLVHITYTRTERTHDDESKDHDRITSRTSLNVASISSGGVVTHRELVEVPELDAFEFWPDGGSSMSDFVVDDAGNWHAVVRVWQSGTDEQVDISDLATYKKYVDHMYYINEVDSSLILLEQTNGSVRPGRALIGVSNTGVATVIYQMANGVSSSTEFATIQGSIVTARTDLPSLSWEGDEDLAVSSMGDWYFVYTSRNTDDDTIAINYLSRSEPFEHEVVSYDAESHTVGDTPFPSVSISRPRIIFEKLSELLFRSEPLTPSNRGDVNASVTADGESTTYLYYTVDEDTLASDVEFQIDETDETLGSTSGLFENGQFGADSVTASATRIVDIDGEYFAEAIFIAPSAFDRSAHATDAGLSEREIQFQIVIDGKETTAGTRLVLKRPQPELLIRNTDLTDANLSEPNVCTVSSTTASLLLYVEVPTSTLKEEVTFTIDESDPMHGAPVGGLENGRFTNGATTSVAEAIVKVGDREFAQVKYTPPASYSRTGDFATTDAEQNKRYVQFGIDIADTVFTAPQLLTLHANRMGQMEVTADSWSCDRDGILEVSGSSTINDFLQFEGALRFDTVTGLATVSGRLSYDGGEPGTADDLTVFDDTLTFNAVNGVLSGILGREFSIGKPGSQLRFTLTALKFIRPDGVEMAGTLWLPESLGEDKGVQIETLRYSAGMWDIVGRVNIPDIKFDRYPWGLTNMYFEFDTIKQEFSGGGTLDTPRLSPGIDRLTIREGEFETLILSVGLAVPGIPIGMSGLFIQSLNGGLEDVQPGLPPLQIVAGAQITLGPVIIIPTFGEVRLLTGEPQLKIDTSFSIALEGDLFFLGTGGSLGTMLGNVNASIGMEGSLRPGAQLVGTLNFVDGALVGVLGLKVDMNLNFEGSAMATLVPSKLDYIWVNWIDDKEKIAIGLIVNKGGFHGSFVRKGLTVKLTYTFEGDLTISPTLKLFKSNGFEESLLKALGEKQLAVDHLVPTDLRQVVFTMDYEVGATDFELTDPAGNVYTPEGADGVNYFYVSNPDDGFAFYVVNYPLGGTWATTVSSPQGLGDVTLSMLIPNVSPVANFARPQGETVADPEVVLTWLAEDPDDDALVSLHFDTNGAGFDGDTIVTGLSETDGLGEYTWDTSEVFPGAYHVYVKVDDGENVPAMAYLDGVIIVPGDTDVPAPTGLALTSSADVNMIAISWEPVDYETLGSYKVYIDELDAGIPVTPAAVGTSTEYSAELITGRSYRIFVTAVDEIGTESAPSTSIVVTPMAPAGENNTPNFISDAVTEAQVAEAYRYEPDAIDMDGDTLSYSLETMPVGMAIDAATGVINWIPDFTQEGAFDLILRVSDGDLSDTQEFSVYVEAATGVDVDFDGLDTAAEIRLGTDLLAADTDLDTLSDGDEVNIYGTSPTNSDTDGDGVDDGTEIAAGDDPLVFGSGTCTGSVRVDYDAADPVRVGTQWQLDGGPWHGDGDVIEGVPAGSHTIAYNSVDGAVPVASVDVDVVCGETTFVVAGDAGSVGEGEGEGEGDPPLCGALWINGAPISGGAGDLALLTLVMGAMLLHRRRRTRAPGQWK